MRACRAFAPWARPSSRWRCPALRASHSSPFSSLTSQCTRQHPGRAAQPLRPPAAPCRAHGLLVYPVLWAPVLVTQVRACRWPASGSCSFWSRPGTQASVQGRMMDSGSEEASTCLNLDPHVAPRTRHQNWELVPATVTRGLGAEPKSRQTLVLPPLPSRGTQPIGEASLRTSPPG